MDPYRIRCFVLWLYYSERVDNIRKYTMHFNNRISCVGGIFLLFVAIKIFESKSLDNYFPFAETVAVSKKYISKVIFFFVIGNKCQDNYIFFQIRKKYCNYMNSVRIFDFRNNFGNFRVRKGHRFTKAESIGSIFF